MIRKLYFDTTSTRFTRAQALIWVANGLTFLNVFEKNSGKLLSKIIDECSCEKSILVNFNGVIRLDDHCLDDVYRSLAGNKKQLIIFNGESLLPELQKLRKDQVVNINHISERKIIILGNQEPSSLEAFFKERDDAIQKYVTTVLKNTFSKFSEFKRLSSTPFFANGEFDSKKIIESPNDFMWISFYLSDKLTEMIEKEQLNDIILVSASLRGSTFTSILGNLNDLEYINIDHIGPIHKVYNFNDFENNHRDKNYIYIGDFVFGGTEIKLTKLYASFGGALLNHALVLGSLFDADAFKDFKLYQLARLREISGEAQFKLFN